MAEIVECDDQKWSAYKAMMLERKAKGVKSIPVMRESLGRVWEQPKRKDILVDSTCAIMKEKDFHLLADYSSSVPSGVYEGKMWKRKMYNDNREHIGHALCWYGFSEKEGCCSTEYVFPILLID